MFLAKLNEALTSKRWFVQDPFIAVSLAVSALINIIHWIILLIKIRPSQQGILLHYNVVSGADLIGKSWYLYLLPLLALLLLIINLILAARFYKKEKLAGYFITIGSIPVQTIFLIATWVLILANSQ